MGKCQEQIDVLMDKTEQMALQELKEKDIKRNAAEKRKAYNVTKPSDSIGNQPVS